MRKAHEALIVGAFACFIGAGRLSAQDLERAAALLRAGRAGEAWRMIEGSAGKRSVQGHLLASRILEDLDRLPGAAAEAEAAVRLDPADEAARLQWGRLFLTGNNPEEALRVFTEGLEASAGSVLLRLGRGLALNRLARYEEAAAEFEHCLERRPALGIALDGLIEALSRLQRFAQARHGIRSYLDHDPRDFRGYYYAAFIDEREGVGSAEGREELLRQSIERNAQHAPSYALLGKTLLRLERPEEAALMLETCIRLKPDDQQGRIQLARAYRLLGRDEDAREQARIIREFAQAERKPDPVLRRSDQSFAPPVGP